MLSLLGAATGSIVLYQIDFIDHPPEPSLPGLDMDTVDASEKT